MFKVVAVAAVTLMAAAPVQAGEVVLEFRDGYVTLSAHDAPVQQILQEWSRLGNTRVVNADQVFGGPVTIELRQVSEKKALAVLLRSAAGYIAAPRAGDGGASRFAQILVMPPSAAPPPRQPSLRPAVVRPPVMPQPMPPVLLDDQDQPVPVDPSTGMPLQGEVPDDSIVPEGAVDDGNPGMMPQPSPYPGVQPYAPPGDPPPQDYPQDGEQPPQPQPVAPGPTPGQGGVVSPTPGQLPAPSPNPNQQPRR